MKNFSIPSKSPQDSIRILITEDHKLLRETLTWIFNSDSRFTVVGASENGEDAVVLTQKLSPDIVLMDVNLPAMNGIEATGQIRRHSPDSKVIGISLHNQPSYARKMMQKGAMGYLTKNASKDEMFYAITEVHNGKKYICEEIKNTLSDQVMSGDNQSDGVNSLSPRELEIIGCIKNGASSKQIAETLCISVKTVEVHRYNILKKLKLKNSASLVNYMSQF